MRFIRVIKSNQILYRGSDKRYGFGHDDWIYLTPSIDYAKWYSSKTKEPQIQKFELLTDRLGSFEEARDILLEQYDESYSLDDFLWYQEGVADTLLEYFDGIIFEDPYEKGNIIYLIFNKNKIRELPME